MASLIKSLFGKKPEPAPSAPKALTPVAVHGEAEVVHVTDDSFEERVLRAPLPALVDFWAPWCGPCRMLAPILEDLAQKYEGRLVLAKLNTDENFQVPADLEIMGIPTVILFKDGVEVDRVVGYAPRHQLEERISAFL